jgi:hypothetical protein
VKKLATSAAARKAIERHEERGKRFEFLKERLARVDVEEVWAELEDGLTLGDGRKNPEKVARALDECDGALRRAGMILQAAIEELEEFDLHYRAAFSEWEAHARETLERAKREKRWSGMVTNDQVENWIARNIADYRRWKEARRSLERNRNLAKQMFAAWESRAASLRKQADVAISRRGVDPNLLDRRGKRRRRDEDEGENDAPE